MEGNRVKREREGRQSKRVPVGIRIYLGNATKPGPVETARTENVAPHGARLLTQQNWHAREEVLFQVPHTNVRIRAQIIYCLARRDGKYDIGVAWRNPTINWIDMPPEALAS